MFSTLVKVALLAPIAIQGALAFAVNNPPLNQCESAKITWEATKGPYDLVIVPAANPCGDALAEVGEFTKTWVDWTVNVAAGTIVQISLVDANDDEAWSRNITVGPGSATCLTSTTTATNNIAGSTPTSGSAGSSTTSDSADPSSSLDAVGAANAGSNALFNAGVSTQQFNMPAVAAVAVAALAMAL
jgi:hypothetical protein